MELKNKIVVITGGTSGIGLSIVKKLLSSCDVKYVALLELDLPECRRVFNNLKNDYEQKIGFYACDVTKTPVISENFDKVIASHGTIDILINNAGTAGESLPEEMVDVNLKAVVVASYALIDRIGKHRGGKGGLIVNIASVLGLKSHVAPVYCATKHGVVSFTRTMKEFYRKTGVSVVAVCPGFTATPLLLKGTNNPDFFDTNVGKLSESYPKQTPENVAAAVTSIIRNGESGDVWVSENDEPPFSVKSVEDYENLKIKDHPA